MAGIAGVFTDHADSAGQLIEDMLSGMRHRGTQQTVKTVGLPKGYAIGIGCCANQESELGFVEYHDRILAMDGSFFTRSKLNSAVYAMRRLSSGSNTRISISALVQTPGTLAILYSNKSRLRAFRDMAGFKPLFYAHNDQLTAYASERKALWKIGLTNVQRLPPDHLHTVSSRGIARTMLPHITQSRTDSSLTMRTATTQLESLLRRAVRRITWKTSEIAVAFSGGLDSSLTAWLVKEGDVSAKLISVGLPDSTESLSAEKYAKQLGLPLTVQTYDLDSLEAYVRRVIWLIEEPSLMKVSIAVPLYWAAQVAANQGYKVMLCGQGSDELYGGYAKFARTLDSQGRRELEKELYRSVVESYIVNYERDDQATAPTGVEIRTPFTDPDLVRLSLTIPSELKVKTGGDVIRKWVLRTVAQKVGLPSEIAWRRKKAIQHGTGVEAAIRRLAKRSGLSPDGYLTRIFEEVRLMDSMPQL